MILKGSEEVEGLIATKIHPNGGVYVELVESAPHNRGKNRKYIGVGGHLFAIACKEAKENNSDYIYFTAKTKLIDYYSKKLGAKQLGNSQTMVIDGKEFRELIKKYFKEI